MNHCIQVEHLHKTFQRRQGKRKETIHAVKDVSFHLESGDSLGIIGSSGCGKSTLVKMILGILKPDQGKVTTAAKVGFVGQDPYASLCPTMKIEKIVAEPLLFTGKKKTYKQCREEVEKVMSFVHLDLEKYGKRLPSQLSGGERQRVGIARALILQPELLVMDEPTSMLDQAVKEEICEIIQQISKACHSAFLMVTHDITLAGQICKQICVMSEGEIIEQGETAEIFQNPKEKLTQHLIMIGTDVRTYWEDHYDI